MKNKIDWNFQLKKLAVKKHGASQPLHQILFCITPLECNKWIIDQQCFDFLSKPCTIRAIQHQVHSFLATCDQVLWLVPHSWSTHGQSQWQDAWPKGRPAHCPPRDPRSKCEVVGEHPRGKWKQKFTKEMAVDAEPRWLLRKWTEIVNGSNWSQPCLDTDKTLADPQLSCCHILTSYASHFFLCSLQMNWTGSHWTEPRAVGTASWCKLDRDKGCSTYPPATATPPRNAGDLHHWMLTCADCIGQIAAESPEIWLRRLPCFQRASVKLH